MSGENLFPHLLTEPYMVEGARALSGVSFIKTVIPFMKALPHDRVTFQRPPSPPNAITLGVRISTHKFGGAGEGHKLSVHRRY